ncbi:hypothetical protein Lser_V15G36959 [Lactuca serriola]
MADALAVHLAELLKLLESQDHMEELIEAFNVLMNYLREMMRGYENNEMYVLFTKIEQWKTSIRHWYYFEPESTPKDMIIENCEKLCDIRFSSNIDGDEIVVGFDDEVQTLLDQLTRTSTKHFQVISITGMAGLGKTTLARKLYKDPLIEYIFDIRAWTCVSQVYSKRDLLLGILRSFIHDCIDETYTMRDEQLGEKLYRLLKGRKYLVVFDDIWDCMAWNDLKIYFPDDKVGSRVVFTSRDIDVSLHVRASITAHILRLRTENESWDIFQKKVFRIGICPSRLEVVGREIAKKCQGLPLAIVITAGCLQNKWSLFSWIEVSRNLHSLMVRDPSQYMDSLVLSYENLPPHLRHSFLFLGVFPEDYEIPVTKLIWLWIAQGLIHPVGNRVVEDIADGFLRELIKRSLLMTTKKTANGQIKACRIHDLLRDLCLRKAKEESFLPQIYMRVPSQRPSLVPAIHLSWAMFKLLDQLVSERYESLMILDMESVPISIFPSGVSQLSNLRYLAIQARDGSPEASISKLVNLQMLIILSRKNIVMPKTIWDMANLRHICIKGGENLIEEKNGCCSGLGSLQTLSQVSPHSCHNIFSRTPNLRKLGFCGPLISNLGDLEFPNIRSLKHLQKLKLSNTIPYPELTRSCNPLMFPSNLKKLTLSNIGLDWDETWTFAWLPNLEVLKLRVHACVGEKWETSDTVFQRLRVLKLHDLDLRQWVSSCDTFPRLQCLVVRHCLNLESIPMGLGKILTLDMIEVSGCSSSAHYSALEIQKKQEQEGNCFLKVNATNNVSGSRSEDLTEQPTEF